LSFLPKKERKLFIKGKRGDEQQSRVVTGSEKKRTRKETFFEENFAQ